MVCIIVALSVGVPVGLASRSNNLETTTTTTTTTTPTLTTATAKYFQCATRSTIDLSGITYFTTICSTCVGCSGSTLGTRTDGGFN